MQLAVTGGKKIDVSEATFGRDFSEALVHQVVNCLPGRRTRRHQGTEKPV